jgi:hypothetical protein
MYAMNIQNDVIGLVLRQNCKSNKVVESVDKTHVSKSHEIYIVAHNALQLTRNNQNNPD